MNREVPIELGDNIPVESDDEILVEIGEISELTFGDIGVPVEWFILNRQE